MTKSLIAVLLMALVTYLPRVLPMAVFQREIRSKKIQDFLYYVPYAVLAAMTFPDIFSSTSSLISAITGTVVALFLSFREKSLVIVAIAAIITVYFTEIFLQIF